MKIVKALVCGVVLYPLNAMSQELSTETSEVKSSDSLQDSEDFLNQLYFEKVTIMNQTLRMVPKAIYAVTNTYNFYDPEDSYYGFFQF